MKRERERKRQRKRKKSQVKNRLQKSEGVWTMNWEDSLNVLRKRRKSKQKRRRRRKRRQLKNYSHFA